MTRVYQKEILALHEQREHWANREIRSVDERQARLSDTRYSVVAQKKINLPQRLVKLGAGT